MIREHNGEVEKLDVVLNEDGTLSFETNQFSTYAFIYEDVKVVQSPITSDTYFVGLYSLMALLSLSILLVLKKKEELCQE